MPAVLLALTPELSLGRERSRPIPSETVGPADTSEQSILWQDSRRAFGEGRYGEAAYGLQRLVSRHPSFEGFLEAQLLLGLSLMRQGKAAEGIDPLKQYIATIGNTTDGFRARLALARAYIAVGKFHEALLSSIEVLDAAATGRLTADLSYEALILKAKAHLALKQETRADRTQSSAETAWNKLPQTEQAVLVSLRAEALWSGLEIKLRSCAKLAPKPHDPEAAVMAAVERRGTCLGESTLIFSRVLDTTDPRWSKESVATLTHGYQGLWEGCMEPPIPTGKRSAEQKRQYKSELVELLRGRCVERIEKGLTLLESSASAPGSEHREDLRRRVRGLYGDSN